MTPAFCTKNTCHAKSILGPRTAFSATGREAFERKISIRCFSGSTTSYGPTQSNDQYLESSSHYTSPSFPLRTLVSTAQPSARDRVTAQSSPTSYSSSRSPLTTKTLNFLAKDPKPKPSCLVSCRIHRIVSYLPTSRVRVSTVGSKRIIESDRRKVQEEVQTRFTPSSWSIRYTTALLLWTLDYTPREKLEISLLSVKEPSPKSLNSNHGSNEPSKQTAATDYHVEGMWDETIDVNNFYNTADAFLQADAQRGQLYAVRTLLSFGQRQSQSGSEVAPSSEDEDYTSPDHRAATPRSAANSRMFEEFSEDGQGPGHFDPARSLRSAWKRRILVQAVAES
ncbi:hypothetical protein FFLO_06511 [Filobasidium floriforme]|uniref:Uncharacterized protein n=1 Tax=Filobasidium floriforme TaxID=5210 RepID=A0A8K0NKH6_9TREE|nr:uncharacterized protein HD553DRAFT_326600 [Filobasidium floriforme]KAG7527915.1 hypothetical protein FFLO_06511 [Filobasidium floriforme]KAH8079373.1 hypothetical protein HD553DRAFT_326600 [Filobasidium floriforme]